MISLTCLSLKILGMFSIFVLCLIFENYHNSRTSNDIDMKLGPVTKLDKENTVTSKKFDVYVVLANFDVIVILPIYGQLRAIRKHGL